MSLYMIMTPKMAKHRTRPRFMAWVLDAPLELSLEAEPDAEAEAEPEAEPEAEDAPEVVELVAKEKGPLDVLLAPCEVPERVEAEVFVLFVNVELTVVA
jgi:hypothetical protein